jgi:hypothetical protein
MKANFAALVLAALTLASTATPLSERAALPILVGNDDGCTLVLSFDECMR